MKNNPYPPNLGDMKQKEIKNSLTLPKSDKPSPQKSADMKKERNRIMKQKDKGQETI